MEAMDISRRLEVLSKVFGKSFTFREPEPESHLEEKDLKEPPSNDIAQSAAEIPKSKGNAPRLFINDDVGPRASTAGAFDCQNYQLGEPLDADFPFVPWKVVTTYGELFIGKTNRPHQRSEPARANGAIPRFLDMVNQKLGISLAIPGGISTDKFFITFRNETPRPRYFQRSRDQKVLSLEELPAISDDDAQLFKSATPVAQKLFLETVSLVERVPKKDGRGKNNQKSQRKKLERKQMVADSQKLLGVASPDGVAEDVVLVCFDVEAIERPPNPISEIGIAILDTRDIAKTAPGPAGQEWWPLIKAHHLRVRELSALVNRDYVQGCPDAFNFGESTFPTKSETKEAILSILNPYIEDGRSIALVGHDIHQDIRYLFSLGIDLANIGSIKQTIDSQALHQVLRELDCGRGLSAVLSDLGISSKNLHNAGNDAVFTLRASIGLAIENTRKQAAKEKGEDYVPEMFAREPESPAEETAEVAKEAEVPMVVM
uniref:Gfd2/YDR514C-like C-terminal domain-containing protein n=1 Tax=Bionectria ochroleuca TaxID=29856 RepID=A0A8H7TPP9_BIOOC